MAKFAVKVALTYHKDLTVFASSEGEAEEKATDICSKWQNVEDVEVLEINEE